MSQTFAKGWYCQTTFHVLYILHTLFIFLKVITFNFFFRANALARIFTEMAESFIFHIVHYPDTPYGSINTFDLLIHCAQHYDYEVCMPPFPTLREGLVLL